MDAKTLVAQAEPLDVAPEPLCSHAAVTLLQCHVCAAPAVEFHAFNIQWGGWRGEGVLLAPGGAKVFVGRGHGECLRRTLAHRVRYFEVAGEPGRFPLLCGPCKHRKGTTCGHPMRGKGELRAKRSEARPLDVVACSGRRAA